MRKPWIALAGVAAVLAIVVLVTRNHGEGAAAPRVDEPDKPLPAHHPMVNEQEAAAMRKAALKACDARQWKACLEGLDRARVIDPAGDVHEDAQAARKVAEAELARMGQGEGKK